MAKALREVGGEQATDLAHQALEVALSIGGTSSADTKLLAEVYSQPTFGVRGFRSLQLCNQLCTASGLKANRVEAR